jgi:gas vesicle protein GvpG
VLGKIVDAVDAEMNDDSVLREELLAAQMRLELGEMTEAEFTELEAALLARIREIQARQREESAASGEFRVTGIDATFGGDERDDADAR